MRIAYLIALLFTLVAPRAALADPGPPSAAAATPSAGLALVKEYNGHGGPVLAVDFHPNGKQLAYGTTTGMLRVRDLTDQGNDSNLADAAGWLAYSPIVVAANPNGTPLGTPSLVTLSPDARFTIWYPDTFQRQGYTDGCGNNGALSTNGRVLAVTFGKLDTYIWPMNHWDPSYHAIQMGRPDGIDGVVTTLALNQNGSLLATGYLLSDGTGAVVAWDRLTGRALNTLRLDQAPGQVVFTPKSKTLLAVVGRNADGTGLVRLLTDRGDSVVATFPAPPVGVLSGRFSWSESYLATGRFDGAVDIWDVKRGQVVASLTGAHQGPIRAVTWSPDDSTLATAGEDGYVRLWKVTLP